MPGKTENNSSQPSEADLYLHVPKPDPTGRHLIMRRDKQRPTTVDGSQFRFDPEFVKPNQTAQMLVRGTGETESSGRKSWVDDPGNVSPATRQYNRSAAAMLASAQPLSSYEYQARKLQHANEGHGAQFLHSPDIVAWVDDNMDLDRNRRLRPEILIDQEAMDKRLGSSKSHRMFYDIVSKVHPSGVDYAGDNLPFRMPELAPQSMIDRLKEGQSLSSRLAREYLADIRGTKGQVTVAVNPDDLNLIENLLLTHQVQFIVEHDWYSALSKIIKDVQDSEIQLPYQESIFEFSYMETPMRGTVYQDPDTFAIRIGDVFVSTAGADVFVTRPWYPANHKEAAVFLEHIKYTCIALETELSVKEQQPMLSFLKALKPEQRKMLKAPTMTYKILPIRKHEPREGSVVPVIGSKQRFHVRRSHWKMVKGERRRIKWYFAGNIELGFVVKDYKLD